MYRQICGQHDDGAPKGDKEEELRACTITPTFYLTYWETHENTRQKGTESGKHTTYEMEVKQVLPIKVFNLSK